MLQFNSSDLTSQDILEINRGQPTLAGGELAERVIEILIREFCSAGHLAVDCGGADGRMTRIMSETVGPTGRVITFEPLPKQFQKLSEEFSSGNVTLKNCCVGKEAQANVTFYHATDRRWVSSLSPDGLEKYDVEEISVPVTTIDETLRENAPWLGARRLNFIKLDIEGAEFSAIRGAAAAIAEHEPIVVFENGLQSAAKRFDYSKDDFFDFFDGLDYRLMDIFGTLLTPDIWGQQHSVLSWNFVAVRRNSVPDLEAFCRDQAIALAQDWLQAQRATTGI